MPQGSFSNEVYSYNTETKEVSIAHMRSGTVLDGLYDGVITRHYIDPYGADAGVAERKFGRGLPTFFLSISETLSDLWEFEAYEIEVYDPEYSECVCPGYKREVDLHGGPDAYLDYQRNTTCGMIGYADRDDTNIY